MSNMSYCRFRNTDRDLSDCQDALEALYNGGGKLSKDELAAATCLVQRCVEIVALFIESASLDDARSASDLVDDLTSGRVIEDALTSANDSADDVE